MSWSSYVCLEHRSTESHGNPQSRAFARVRLSPECPLRAETHSPAGEGPEDAPWERSQAVPTRGLGDAGANLSCQQPQALDEEVMLTALGRNPKGGVNVAEK